MSGRRRRRAAAGRPLARTSRLFHSAPLVKRNAGNGRQSRRPSRSRRRPRPPRVAVSRNDARRRPKTKSPLEPKSTRVAPCRPAPSPSMIRQQINSLARVRSIRTDFYYVATGCDSRRVLVHAARLAPLSGIRRCCCCCRRNVSQPGWLALVSTSRECVRHVSLACVTRALCISFARQRHAERPAGSRRGRNAGGGGVASSSLTLAKRSQPARLAAARG
jgi:hypothetical protein